jgi:hypothetical protein
MRKNIFNKTRIMKIKILSIGTILLLIGLSFSSVNAREILDWDVKEGIIELIFTSFNQDRTVNSKKSS